MLSIMLLAFNIKANQFIMHYNFKGIKLDTYIEASDYNEAIEKGADSCFLFYTKVFKISQLTENEKVGLANVCTNPR